LLLLLLLLLCQIQAVAVVCDLARAALGKTPSAAAHPALEATIVVHARSLRSEYTSVCVLLFSYWYHTWQPTVLMEKKKSFKSELSAFDE
jgi:hypothetical protein